MKLALWIYRLLAGAFPHEFKLVYGAEVTQLGEDILEEVAQRHGFGGLVRLVADIAIRMPLEYLSEMRGDFRYAARGLMKSPGFSLVGIVSLGIGIGLTTMIYDSKWQLISRELPAAANAKRLAMPEKPVSYYYIEQYRAQKSLFTGVAAFQTGVPFNVTLRSDVSAKPERVFGQLVSADYFSVLGVQPQRGRVLSAGLDKPGDAPVVVISDRFLAQSSQLLPGCGGAGAAPERTSGNHCGNRPGEFQWRRFHQSGRAVRSGHSSGGSCPGARERCAASARCQGIPGHVVSGARSHRGIGGSRSRRGHASS